MTRIEEFENSPLFKKHCKESNVKPTRTQASKFLRGKGAAYQISVLHLEVHVVPHARYFKDDGESLNF